MKRETSLKMEERNKYVTKKKKRLSARRIFASENTNRMVICALTNGNFSALLNFI